jgi:hypothetical protein
MTPPPNPPSAPRPKQHWTERLQSFDRRWLFLAMGVAIVIPLLFPLNLPVKPSPMVQSAFYTVEELKEGDVVFVSLDLEPASTPELEPYFRAVMLQLKRKNVKLVFATTWYAAPPLCERWIREMVERPIAPEGTPGYDGPPDRAYRKNVDYVWLGFREGKQAVISAFGADLRGTFDGRAADGTPLDQIPMMSGIKKLKDFKLLVMLSAGFPGIKEYVQQVQKRYNLRIVGASTAVQTTDLTPYYQAGQILGLVGGLANVAEYEALVGKKGTATQGADVLNVTHGMVILAIIFGNVIYFASRRRRRGQGTVAP